MRQITAIVTFAICLMTVNAYAQYHNDAFLPHIANGSFDRGSYRTTFILFNNTDNNDSALLRLTDNDGKLLTVRIPGLGSGSEFAVDLPPGATRIFQTDGSGGLVTGAATVTSSSAIGLSAVFSVYDTSGNFLTESGVGDSPAVSDFVIPVDVTGDFNTGLALLNPAQVETSVSLTLIDSNGKQVAMTNRTIAAGGHLATFVAGPGQLFPSTTTFRGMLAVSSTGAIAALTLRQNDTPLSYTSLPVVPPYGAQTRLYLPHVANGSYGGGSFKTSFIFMNPQAMPANVRLSLATSGGTPFQVALSGKGTGSSFDFKLEHNASVILQTDGSGPLTVGTATIESDVPIGASGIFTVLDAQGRFQTEAGVGASTEVSGATLPVDVTGRFDTGVAFLNTSSATVQLTLTLLNENGEVLQGSKKIPLPGMNHTAKFVSELFPGTANFRGSLVVSGANVVALTLRQNSLPLSYTTLPVRQGVSHGKVLPLLTQAKTGIAATGDVVVNATLAAGFKLAGRIDGPGYLAQVAAQSSTGEVFVGRFGYSLSGPKYLLVLPAGAYTLKVCYQAQGGYANITFTDPNPVQVTADTTRDITLPPASLTDISGTVSGLSNLPPLQSKSIVFNSMDNSVWVQLRLEDDGKYSGKITPGSYRANLYLPNVKFQDGHIQDPLTVFNFGAVNVGSSPVVASFTLPPLANLSGRVSGTDISMAGVYATDRSAPAMAYDACGYFPAYSITGIDPSGQFQLTLVKDRAYDIQVEQYLTRYGGVYYGTVRYPVPASVVNLSSDGRLDISAPSLPDGVVISGKVTDSAGRPVGNVEVEVVSQSLTGVTNATLSRWELTDSDGNYRMLVLSGTNYKLTFYPPIPAP